MVDSCRMCGQCCHYEIPMTLLDIQRIARYQGMPEEEAFGKYLQPRVSSTSSLFMIAKDDNGACVFLGAENKCSVHSVKPKGCAFYQCAQKSVKAGDNILPWTATCSSPATRAELWEQSVATMFTQAYIEKNGAAFNKDDYYKAIVSIYEHIVTSDRQKLKLAKNENGRPLAQLYDCSRCEKRGTWVNETPVTLDDIRRITAHLGLNWSAFFKEYVDNQSSASTGGLRLKRNGQCAFFDAQTHCAISDVRPMHCSFTPCPRRTANDQVMDCLFLGSGTVEEQYRHQVALAMTRQYVAENGTGYHESAVRRALGDIDRCVRDREGFDEFCRSIAAYRYVDDALLALGQHEKMCTG